jgi:glycine dehydrogenase
MTASCLSLHPKRGATRKAELDRFCDACIIIRGEIRAVEAGLMDVQNIPIKGAPHAADMVMSSTWSRPHSLERAVFPAPWLADNKFWSHVGRIDNVRGDRNLVCTCPPMQSYG